MRFVILTTSLLMWGRVLGQGYIPFLTTTDWYVMSADQMGVFPFWYNHVGDTTVGNDTYAKIRRDTSQIFLVKEDAGQKRVWVRFPNEGYDRLAYDYSLSVGATINIDFNVIGVYQYTVEKIDTAVTLAGNRRRWWLSTSSMNKPDLRWIEGIGDMMSPLYLYDFNGVSDPSYWLICAYEGTVQNYQSTSGDTCPASPLLSAKGPFKVSPRLKIHPNPFTSHTTLETGSLKSEVQSLKLYSLNGQLLREEEVSGESKITLHRNGLPASMYFVEVTGENGVIGREKVVITD